jgi:hypothetical protein
MITYFGNIINLGGDGTAIGGGWRPSLATECSGKILVLSGKNQGKIREFFFQKSVGTL